MKVLVTGATSLLGRHVTGLLLARGDDVTTFQRGESGLATREVRADIRDLDALLAAAKGHDAVIHVAALVAPRPRWEDAFAINVGGTRHARLAAETCGRFVHISSPSVAFDGRGHIGQGTKPASYTGSDRYTRSKALAEQLVLDQPRVPTVVIRPHLVWGPGDTQLVGRIIERAKKGQLRLPNHGVALIDTTYITDAAAAIVAGLDAANESSPAINRAWTVTGNDPRPLAELVNGILQAAGISSPVKHIDGKLALRVGALIQKVWWGDEPPLTRFAAQQLSFAHTFDQRDTQIALQWLPTVSTQEGLRRLNSFLTAVPETENSGWE